MRGLKRGNPAPTFRNRRVASLTDAWIETNLMCVIINQLCVASLTDAWIETYPKVIIPIFVTVASLTDAWIETTRPAAQTTASAHSRIPHGCVD